MTGDPRNIGDAAAYGGGVVGSIMHWADLSNALASHLSMVFLLLSVVWILWRMVDRVRNGRPTHDE